MEARDERRPDLRSRRASIPPRKPLARSRHQVLRELLGAYADRELPPETTAQIDAHLIGCVECRRELEVHDAIRGRLAAEPPAASSPALRARIAIAIDAAPLPAVVEQAGSRRSCASAHHLARRRGLGDGARAVDRARHPGELRAQRAAGGRAPSSAPVRSVPLLEGIVDDYARVIAGRSSRTRKRPVRGSRRDVVPHRAAARAQPAPARARGPRTCAASRRRFSRIGSKTGSSCSISSPRTRSSVIPPFARPWRTGIYCRDRQRQSDRRLAGRGHRDRARGRRAPTLAAGHLADGEGALILHYLRTLVADSCSTSHHGAGARRALATRHRSSTPQSAAPPDSLSPDSLAARLARAEAAIALLRQQLATESQSTVRTRSRLQLELTGRILTNSFMTFGRVEQRRRAARRARAARGGGGRRVRCDGAPVADRCGRDGRRACSAARSSATWTSTSSAACRTAPAIGGSFPSRACARRARGCGGTTPRSWSAWTTRSSRCSIP